MYFKPYVLLTATDERIPVSIDPAAQDQLALTHGDHSWQTDWTTEYLADPTVDKYAVTTDEGELIGLGAYQIRNGRAYVLIVYAESAPHSNPTMHPRAERKYYGIGQILIAFGIKYSIDNGCRGDVVFEAKTDELACHYEEDYHAVRIPSLGEGLKRYMLSDERAWLLFSKFLEEDTE